MVPKGPGANPALAALAGNDNIAFKPQVKHVVSKELILFFDKIRAALLDEDPDPEVVNLRESALESIRSDPGLHQLVPYFVQFVAEKVTHSLNNPFVLRQMMELTAALTSNQSLFLDPYVAALIPPILTCLIGRNLGPEGVDNLKDQYLLRDLAASLIGLISKKYAHSSQQIRGKLARTCLQKFLDPSRSLGEHYGAISGMLAVGGAEAVCALIIPNLKAYEYVIIKAQNERGESSEGVRMILAVILRAILSVADKAPVLTNGSNGFASEGQAVEDYLGGVLGKRVVALGNHELNLAILETRKSL